MNLANRLDDLAREKAELEAEDEFEDDFQQIDWPVRGNKISTSRVRGQHATSNPRQAEQMEEEEDEEMEENGVDDEMEDDEDDQQISRKQGNACVYVGYGLTLLHFYSF